MYTVGAIKTSTPRIVPGHPRTMYPVCPGSEGTLYPVCPGTMYPHCPPGDQSEARKSMTTNHSLPWGAMRYIVPGQTRYNAGAARFVCPDCYSDNPD